MFEKLETMEKRKPGTLAKVFSTHPPTGDRITNAQNEISEDFERKTRVRGDDFGIQRRQEPARDAREPPQADRCLSRRSKQADFAAKSELDRAD